MPLLLTLSFDEPASIDKLRMVRDVLAMHGIAISTAAIAGVFKRGMFEHLLETPLLPPGTSVCTAAWTMEPAQLHDEGGFADYQRGWEAWEVWRAFCPEEFSRN